MVGGRITELITGRREEPCVVIREGGEGRVRGEKGGGQDYRGFEQGTGNESLGSEVSLHSGSKYFKI